MNVQGKIAVATGAAVGIGRATALALAEAGVIMFSQSCADLNEPITVVNG